MKLSELGEKKIVSALTKGLYTRDFITLSAGLDDAAAIHRAGEEIVFTSDIMFESTHFPKGMAPESIGWKAAAANISDLAAMGAQPLAFLASFGLPPSLELSFVQSISRGINDACRAHECPFAGGDTKKASELTICGSAIGSCKSEAGLIRRGNMRPGDVVCVTGSLGDAACGAQILLKGRKLNPQADRKLLGAFLKPKAQVKAAVALSALEARMAGMDITDGLFYSANELATISGCGIRIHEELIPFSPEARKFAHEILRASPVRILEWGEDYELLLAMRKKDFARANAAVEAVGGKLIPIGEAIKEKTVFLCDERVDVHGYDAFLAKR